MADWISSKLKVAETFLQQIDQQAAESLRKNEKPQSDDLNFGPPTRSNEAIPLKDQLKKKTTENSDLVGKLRNDDTLNVKNKNHSDGRDKEIGNNANLKAKSGLTDSDWTELLSVPDKKVPPSFNKHNGVSGIHGLKRDGGKKGMLGSGSERRLKGENNISKSSRKSGTTVDGIVNGRRSVGKSKDRDDAGVLDHKHRGLDVMFGRSKGYISDDKNVAECIGKEEASEERDIVINGDDAGKSADMKDDLIEAGPQYMNENCSIKAMPLTAEGLSDFQVKVNNNHNRVKDSIGVVGKYEVDLRSLGSAKRNTLAESDGGSDSETNSSLSSDSESEWEREERRRRQQILAERAAAKAVEAIKERENTVARLEGEKQSLEKILEERAKQQAQEASELQTSMMETMEAVDLEKQRHNNTRMEALARLAKLETANADLARSLATAQWNLEVEVNRVAELRQQIELKEASQEDLRRKIFCAQQTGSKIVASKGVEFEREILEAECSFIIDKVGRLQEKARRLETSIEMTQQEIENPTEVEVELKRRLGQLTDQLIQKQAQVEALSAEKATLMFRIEAASILLEENRSTDLPSMSSRDDLESGIWELSNAKLRPLIEQKFRSTQRHLGALIQQLDIIFCAGAIFLRSNSAARMWSLVYLVCLHFWVLYILMSHSSVSDESRSGAVVSLENINNTGV